MKCFTFFMLLYCSTMLFAQDFEKDVIQTSKGDLEITFIGHGTLLFKFDNKIIHVDPVSREADYSKMPKADLVLITHEHGDHLDSEAINLIKKESTKIFLTNICKEKLGEGEVIANGKKKMFEGILIKVVPAYNIKNKRNNGTPYHPNGDGNGYILTFADKSVYVAGDTENTPEMKKLKNIDIAFLPMNLPYTMTPEMVADAAKAFKPTVIYPYHYGKTDPEKLVELLETEKNIEVRIRKME